LCLCTHHLLGLYELLLVHLLTTDHSAHGLFSLTYCRLHSLLLDHMGLLGRHLDRLVAHHRHLWCLGHWSLKRTSLAHPWCLAHLAIKWSRLYVRRRDRHARRTSMALLASPSRHDMTRWSSYLGIILVYNRSGTLRAST